jgi:hypothetical protein
MSSTSRPTSITRWGSPSHVEPHVNPATTDLWDVVRLGNPECASPQPGHVQAPADPLGSFAPANGGGATRVAALNPARSRSDNIFCGCLFYMVKMYFCFPEIYFNFGKCSNSF